MNSFFVHRGFAVLRYDKRGVGRSTGNYTGVGVENSTAALGDLASDALAAVQYLKSRSDVRGKLIGLVGVSQAGWIIPLAAAQSRDVSFTVLLSGPTCTVGQEIHYSRLTGDVRERKDISVAAATEGTRRYPGPHGFDPLLYLRSLNSPGLWVFGAEDRSIPVPICVEILDSLIREEGKDFTYLTYPDTGHGLRSASGERQPSLPAAYEWLKQKFDLEL